MNKYIVSLFFMLVLVLFSGCSSFKGAIPYCASGFDDTKLSKVQKVNEIVLIEYNF